MTKEEKKLFEKIKCKCGYGIRTQASFDVIEEMEGTKAKEKAIEYQGEVDFLIYLIEKLQKEIEVYRNDLYGTRLIVKERDKEIANSIPKDKIKELIVTLGQHKNDKIDVTITYKDAIDTAITALGELLEDK